MKIALVLPAEGSLNLGNEMICEATRNILKRLHSCVDINEFTYLKRPSPNELQRINSCDQAIFVGTNIFQSHAVGWEWQTEDLEKVEVPYSLYGVGYSGPLKGNDWEIYEETRDLVNWARRAETIGARDSQTVNWLKYFGLRSELIGCPVIAYADNFSGIAKGKGEPVLAIRQILLHNSGEEAEVAQRVMIEWFFKEYPDSVCVVQELADLELLEGRPVLTRFKDIIQALAQARFVLTSRLHAGMMALSLGRPVVFLAHDTRVASFCEMIGLPIRELSFQGLKESIAAIQAIERGDLSEFGGAVQRIPHFRQRLEKFLEELILPVEVSRSQSRWQKALIRIQADISELRQELSQMRSVSTEAQALRKQLQAKEEELGRVRQLSTEAQALKEQLQAKDRELATLQQTLNEIYSSLAWKLLGRYWRLLNWLLPPGTRRRSFYGHMLRTVKIVLEEGFGGYWRRMWQRLWAEPHQNIAGSASGSQRQLANVSEKAYSELDFASNPLSSIRPKRDKVRLIVVVPSMEAGGAERCTEVLLRHFHRELVELELVTIFDREPFYRVPGDVQMHVLERYHQPRTNGSLGQLFPELAIRYADELAWLEATAYKLGLLMRKRQPDAILAQDFYASVITLIAKEYMPREVKVIGSLHTQCSRFLQTVHHGDLYSTIIRRYVNQAYRVIAVSQGIAQDLIENFGVRPDIVSVIHNPLDLDQITNLAQEPISEHRWLSEEIPIFLYVGRLSSQKGLEYLLQAVALARQLEKFRCVIVGDGEKRQELETLVHQLKITENVAFIGRQSNPFKFMHRATCFMLPSVVEGLPYVIPEAMACGCPIIATDCAPGVRELLGEGVRGFLVPPKDCYALAEAILKILWNTNLSERLARAGLEYVKAFAVEKIVVQYEELVKTHVLG